jgi:WXG100 family type VII secretion target
MAGFAVDPGELQRGGAGLAHSCACARAAVAGLRADADELFADGWHGAAAVGFRLSWEHWLAGVDEMLTALDELAVLLGDAAVGYADAETCVRADVGRTAA